MPALPLPELPPPHPSLRSQSPEESGVHDVIDLLRQPASVSGACGFFK